MLYLPVDVDVNKYAVNASFDIKYVTLILPGV